MPVDVKNDMCVVVEYTRKSGYKEIFAVFDSEDAVKTYYGKLVTWVKTLDSWVGTPADPHNNVEKITLHRTSKVIVSHTGD